MKLPPIFLRPGTDDELVVRDSSDYADVHITAADIVLDLGANIGTFTRRALESDARVIAVEAEPDNFACLVRNAPYAVNICAAVSGEPGTRTLNLEGPHTCVHSVCREPSANSTGKIVVPTVTLPELVRAFCPTIIKCDIEGAESELCWQCVIDTQVKQIAAELHSWVNCDAMRTALGSFPYRSAKPSGDGHQTLAIWKR